MRFNRFDSRVGALITVVLILLTIGFIPGISISQICGDINSDQSITVLDITYFISYLYKNGPVPQNLAMCDVNCSESINILDVLYLLSFLYKQGPAPNCAFTGPQGLLTFSSGCKPYFTTTGFILYRIGNLKKAKINEVVDKIVDIVKSKF